MPPIYLKHLTVCIHHFTTDCTPVDSKTVRKTLDIILILFIPVLTCFRHFVLSNLAKELTRNFPLKFRQNGRPKLSTWYSASTYVISTAPSTNILDTPIITLFFNFAAFSHLGIHIKLLQDGSEEPPVQLV